MTNTQKPIGQSGDFEIVIGSSSSCELHLSAAEVPGIAKRHARLKRIRDRLFIQDLGAQQGTYLDGERLAPKTWAEIAPKTQCHIRFGDTPVGIDPQLFRGRPRLGVHTTPLYYQIKTKMICQGLFLRAQPGTMTAIMGPAGCGKSSFLDVLNGYRQPQSGQVFIRRQHEYIALEQARVHEWLGYLPQDDILIPELTVWQSLSYCLRLQFIHLDSRIQHYLIRQTCQSLGFDQPQRLKQFLHTQIGSAASGIQGLSGGERKRANLAHELISMPLILLLDEPTSGLSSVDAEQIIRLLFELTQQHELTVIATIHQPSRDVFQRFDNLLLMTQDGRMAYYGPTAQATVYFERLTATPCGPRNPAEYLLEVLAKAPQFLAATAFQPEFTPYVGH
ncbi:MAG: ATP-binding cassette domain-containing protein [Pseudomonadota bacterium]|nr:ATP-binding cassette domain-containing protein [Pseudomonadota bacterium]